MPLCSWRRFAIVQLSCRSGVRLDIVLIVDKRVGFVAHTSSALVFPISVTVGADWMELEIAEWVRKDELCDYQTMNDAIHKSTSIELDAQRRRHSLATDDLPGKHPGDRGVCHQYCYTCPILICRNDAIDDQEDQKGNKAQKVNPGQKTKWHAMSEHPTRYKIEGIPE